MLFNSLSFVIFFSIFYLFYWFVFKNLKFQNLLILVGSYFFYAWWDWRFLGLIIISTIVDYIVGDLIYRSKKIQNKKFFLRISISLNLLLLCFFKYFNFFIDSFNILLANAGLSNLHSFSINIILPVGISFYTFQTMSYSLDIYYGKLKPTKNFIAFASFISFFPQLVAGPIERARNLLPQILNKRTFDYNRNVEGMRLIIWGMFKKVVIANPLGQKVDYIFNNYETMDGGILILGLIYFSFQIYCDFSGYSDIAIGLSKLLGIELKSNFKFPYFSRNISEFWNRWHISLSSWFRDYVYIPIGGSKHGICKSIRNVFIIFLISGFWHGSNWTFIFWGLMHAIIYIPSFLAKSKKRKVVSLPQNSALVFLKSKLEILRTYIVIVITWVFFRSETLVDSFQYLISIVNNFRFPSDQKTGMVFVMIIVVSDYLWKGDERNPLMLKRKVYRYLAYVCTILFIFIFFNNPSQFIYFQF